MRQPTTEQEAKDLQESEQKKREEEKSTTDQYASNLLESEQKEREEEKDDGPRSQ